MRGVILGVVAAAIIALASPAMADRKEDWKDCGQTENDDRTIDGCTRVLKERRESQNDRALAFSNRASAYHNKKEYDRAIADHDQAIKLVPRDYAAYSNRASVYRDKRDYDRAIADYDQALRLVPDFDPTYFARAIVYRDKKDYDRAMADYGQAIRLDPKIAKYWSGRCWARAIANRDLALARADCTASLRLDPDDAETIDRRGFVYLRLGQSDAAIDEYDAALENEPKLAASLYGRGLAKRQKGDKAGGDADIAAAKAIDAGIAEEFATYGVVPR